MRRRDFLKLGGLAAVSALAPDPWGSARASTPSKPAVFGEHGVYFVPGNVPSGVYYKGLAVRLQPDLAADMPKGYQERGTLLTRIDGRDGSVRRRALPVAGHDITVRADGKSAVCNGRDGTTMVSFDPVGLEMDVFLEYQGRVGGGHSIYLPDGGAMAVTERVPYGLYTGTAQAHYGYITIRDNQTLQPLEQYSAHGIGPHDINLLEDGKHAAIACYGSTGWPANQGGFTPYQVEPSLTVIELASGKLVHRYVPEPVRSEYRHLAAHSPERIFVLQNAKTLFADYLELTSRNEDLQETPFFRREGLGDASLPVVQIDFSEDPEIRLLAGDDPTTMLRGQSIAYDRVHDEAIATFPVSNCVIAFSGKDGSVSRVIRTDRMGLYIPRGIAMHPDGKHYVVAGDEAGVYVFTRGSHALVRERCHYHRLYRHSHMTAA